MTTERTHGPCTCKPHAEDDARDATGIVRAHLADCPSLYPAQQEPDALTRLVRHLRRCGMSQVHEAMALSLISEAREEQRRAHSKGWDDGLDEAARTLESVFDQPTMAAEVRAKKVTP